MLGLSLLKTMVLVGSLSASSLVHSSELVVVVHKDNPTEHLTRSQLIDLYMGKYVAFPDGSKAQPLDIDNDETTKEQFYQALVGMPLNRVNAYWSRVKFSGRARPPVVQQDQQAVLAYIESTGSAIAYIHKNNLTDKVKVVYRFDE
ncbi:hypothetical protein OPS25_13470 [Alteromonas ponticola]|uniref:Phosphate ABC transporter substrate-binding protein n=1 Tax=Alteromonas aquimaris TaxID=2998417 RepID=A0ABT3P9S5_9ALTE|nr:hypothetical protein [Alteromonas aquimaris]MCW8109514.1 hypothetical protein [Alteromonas aquimaris]